MGETKRCGAEARLRPLSCAGSLPRRTLVNVQSSDNFYLKFGVTTLRSLSTKFIPFSQSSNKKLSPRVDYHSNKFHIPLRLLCYLQEGFCHCGNRDNCTATHISGFLRVGKNSSAALKLALVSHGPIASSVNSDKKTFRFYSHGIYDDPECGKKLQFNFLPLIGSSPNGCNFL